MFFFSFVVFVFGVVTPLNVSIKDSTRVFIPPVNFEEDTRVVVRLVEPSQKIVKNSQRATASILGLMPSMFASHIFEKKFLVVVHVLFLKVPIGGA